MRHNIGPNMGPNLGPNMRPNMEPNKAPNMETLLQNYFTHNSSAFCNSISSFASISPSMVLTYARISHLRVSLSIELTH